MRMKVPVTSTMFTMLFANSLVPNKDIVLHKDRIQTKYRHKCTNTFSLPGEQSEWYYATSPSIIHDLHFFKGKIYTIDWNSQLCELRLNREPTLTLLNMKNFPWAHNYMLEFLSSSENLFVVDAVGDVLAVEADFDEMKWVNSNRTIGAYAVFLSNFKCAAAIRPDTWIHPWTQYQRLNFSDGYDPSKTRRICFTTNMWYFPHDCLIDTDPG
ncbi:hypothetical protein Hanom_Chr16g01492511 [Helianthus anomalus]